MFPFNTLLVSPFGITIAVYFFFKRCWYSSSPSLTSPCFQFFNELLRGVSGDEQPGARGQVKPVGQWLGLESCELGRGICFPIFYGAYGLCLPVQVLKFSYTGCTEYACDFYPPKLLVLVMSPHMFLFSSFLHMSPCCGEEQLLWFLWCWILPHSRTQKHVVSLAAKFALADCWYSSLEDTPKLRWILPDLWCVLALRA